MNGQEKHKRKKVTIEGNSSQKEKPTDKPTVEEIHAAYETILIPAIEAAQKIARNPGGTLFTTVALKAIGVDPTKLQPTDRLKIGTVEVSGNIFQLVIGYYDFLENLGYKLGCMDPRPAHFKQIAHSCMHHECGAAGLTSKLTLNDESLFKQLTGTEIEEQVVNQIPETPYLTLLEGTSGGHQDTGAVIIFRGSYLIADPAQEQLIQQGMGGAYVLTLDVDLINQYIQSLKAEVTIDETTIDRFINALVDFNVGIALDIASGDHNNLNTQETGFNLIRVNAAADPSQVERKIESRIRQLVANKLSQVQIFEHQLTLVIDR